VKKVVVAPDSFKGSCTAHEAAAAMARGIRAASPGVEVIQLPIADGGEGTLAVLADRTETVTVTHATGAPCEAVLGWSQQTAIVEVAQAVGLPSVPEAARDPWHLTSAGVGELIARAIARGARRVFVTLGGSATVDGGAGMLHALGASLRDGKGRALAASPAAWAEHVATVDLDKARATIGDVELIGLSDVTSPLLGAGGARMFMRQKGVTESRLDAMEAALARLASAADAAAHASVAGAGAAGGLGVALLALGAELRSGADAVLDHLGFDEALRGADLMLTGEGSFDAQSLAGKATGVAIARARAAGVTAAVICGIGQAEALPVVAVGAGLPLEEAMRRAPALIEAASSALVGRLGADPARSGA
jgi:glycerate kinase